VEFGKILAPFVGPVLGAVDQMAVDDLLGEGEGTAQLLAGSFNAGGNAGIDALDHVEIEKHVNLVFFTGLKIEKTRRWSTYPQRVLLELVPM
jgi:hypothetical protein